MNPIYPVGIAILIAASALTASESPSALQQDSSGWENLLSDTSLSQWERVPPGPGTQYALKPASPWKLDPESGILSCQAEGLYELFLHRSIREDGILHVEWRYPEKHEKPDSGILIRASGDASTWLQAQLAIPGLGTLSSKVPPEHQDKKVSRVGTRSPELMKPDGEWNTMEIISRNGTITLWFNGKITASVEQYGFRSGRIGLQAEFTPVEFRNILFKPL